MAKTEPKYIFVADQIKQAIKRREFVDKLPGERKLAKDFGFSYMTIRKAIDILVDEGILYKVPTKGAFVAHEKAVKKKTNNIGYFLDSSIKDGLTSPYYSMIFNALEKEATRNGYTLMFFSNISESNLPARMKKVDGMIVSCFPRIEHIIHDMKEFNPLVVIDNDSSDMSIPSVVIDNFNSVVDSINYLCDLGHKRIGFMTGLEDSDVGTNRYAGYKNALNKHGIRVDEKLVFKGNYSFESGLAGADYFLSLENRPTAIMCANDSMAIGIMKKLREADVSVPDDISVVGFDDITMASRISPPLTTVSAPVNDIAQMSFKMLDTLIRGEQLETMHLALPGKLKIRDTCTHLKRESVVA